MPVARHDIQDYAGRNWSRSRCTARRRVTLSLSSGAHSRDLLADPPYGPQSYPEERALARVSKDGGRLRALRPSFETHRSRDAPQDEGGVKLQDEDGVERTELYWFSIFVMVFLPPTSPTENVTLSPACHLSSPPSGAL